MFYGDDLDFFHGFLPAWQNTFVALTLSNFLPILTPVYAIHPYTIFYFMVFMVSACCIGLPLLPNSLCRSLRPLASTSFKR